VRRRASEAWRGSLATVSHSVQAAAEGAAIDHERDQLRTARLLFDAELTAGALAPDALSAAAVTRATRVRRVPPLALRRAAQVRYRFGKLDFETGVVVPLLAARRAALGDRSAAKPRLLIRVDEFPHYRAWDEPERYGTDAFERFHEILAEAGVSYLVAVLPSVSREPESPTTSGSRQLEDDELQTLARIRREGVDLALHGHDHRTRFVSPRRHSELCGLSIAQTEDLLDRALSQLAPHDIHPNVFVPPYNRFDADQYPVLARRFAVVCGGPESIGTMGFHSSPQWRGGAVYLPSYRPLYGTAAQVLPAVERAIERDSGLWLPIVLHWGWELRDGWQALRRLAARIAPYTAGWDEFQAVVARSR
jgi:peptidoglycan/xylan/chitin deacetylase (PgdA/CDA1 family)